MIPEHNWAPDLPFMHVRRFIAERLRVEPPSHDLDKQVIELLGADIREPILPVTSDLDATLLLIPDGWWWFINHHEAKVIPTRAIHGAPFSNATLYDYYGKPVAFSALCWEKTEIPAALCEALLKARYDLPPGFVVEASASAHNELRKRMESYKERLRKRSRDTPINEQD